MEYTHETKWVAAADVRPGQHCVLYPRVPMGPGAPISTAEAELRGWYQAEGWSERGSVHLGLHESKDPIDYIVGLAKETYPGALVSVYPDPARHAATIRIGVGPEIASTYREQYGPNSVEMRVPPMVWQFNHAQTCAFLKGYIRGDGCITRKPGSKYTVVSMTSASNRLMFEIQHLLTRIGVFASYTVTGPREDRFSKRSMFRLTIEGRQIEQMLFLDPTLQWSDRQAFFCDEKHFYLPCTSVERQEYTGQVYNAETADNTYLGAFVVHNSEQREWYKVLFRLYHPEEEPEDLRGEHIP